MTINTTPPVGLSVWELEIFDHLVRHLRAEDELVTRYEALADEAGGHVGYLLRLIVEDERRHHRLFGEWCNSLHAAATFGSVPPEIPPLTRTLDPDAVAAEVNELLAAERADRKELGRLRKLIKDVRDDTLWDVLLDVMAADTDKHIALLRFLKRHPGR